jgi:hypothetical protein
MSGKQTSLITGSNAKIVFDGKTLAYATDVQYDVSVQTIPVEVMGKYEVLANEPVAYLVAGSFAVVRYTAAAKPGLISGAAAGGNGLGNIQGTANSTAPNAALSGGGNSVQMDPGQLLLAKTVDIALFRKKVNNPTAAGEQEMFMTIKDARLTRMGGSVNKRGVLMEQYQFVAEIAYNDSFVASASGENDLDQ